MSATSTTASGERRKVQVGEELLVPLAGDFVEGDVQCLDLGLVLDVEDNALRQEDSA